MNPIIPKTPFSLPFEPRKSLLALRLRAIAEGPGGRRRRGSAAAAGLLLLMTLLCVNLVSCAGAERSAIPAVLAGEKEYYSRVYGGYLDLEHLSRAEIPDYPEIETDYKCNISKFAVVDLDGDGTLEALLDFGYEQSASGRIAILHERDGEVYVYVTNYRTIHPDALHTDGTCTGSSGAAYHHIFKISSFTDDGTPVYDTIASIDGYRRSINDQVYSSEHDFLVAQIAFFEGKTLVEWYPFEGADFYQYFK